MTVCSRARGESMNLHIRGAGLLGLGLLLAVSVAGCGEEAAGAGKVVIPFIEHQKIAIPESVLRQIGKDAQISSRLPDLVRKVPASPVMQSINNATEGLSAEKANEVTVKACKLAKLLPGEASNDPSQLRSTFEVRITLEKSKLSDNVAVSTICRVAEMLDAANGI